MAPQDFEHRLIEALQPIRHLALAHALYALMDSGAYDTMAGEPGLSAAELAERHGLDPERFTGLCHHLANEGYLVGDDGWQLTDKARTLAPFRPWYTLLVGGYSGAFSQLGATLKAGAPWASRNGAKVAAGSCGMGRYDALPLCDSLLDAIPAEALAVIDLGCGDGAFLTELARRRSGLHGVGIEPDPDAARLAKERVEREGLADRIVVQQGSAADSLSLDLPAGRPLCFLTVFVLQEMLEQEGDAAVEDLLRKTLEAYPTAHWLVIEVDHQWTDRRSMAHGLSQAYYNPYFLLHAITEQRLEKREFWEAMFDRAGLEVAAFGHPGENVDSTRLELGYLLRRARPPLTTADDIASRGA
jgi:2-ketoarginine methyltransferase